MKHQTTIERSCHQIPIIAVLAIIAALAPVVYGSVPTNGGFESNLNSWTNITGSVSISNADWLSVNPPNGSSTGEADTITINYNTSGLTTGTYDAVIEVSAFCRQKVSGKAPG